jgi:hypothetical protein
MAQTQSNPRQALAIFLNRVGGDMLPDNDSHEFRFTIKSESSDRLYTVARRKRGEYAGRWECSCMGWIRHRTCKHLGAMGTQLRAITDQRAG